MARSIWKGTLGFGLVTIGVELLTAERAEELDLDMLDRRDHARIGYQKINKTTGEVVPPSEIVKGMEVSAGHYVVLTNEDIKAANPKATQSVDIVAFVNASDIPLVFYAKPYYVSPLKGSEKAYALLRDALAESKRIAIAQIVIHTRQHLAAVYPHEHAIVVQLLRYAHELKSPDDAGVKEPATISRTSRAQEFKMARQLIDSMDSEFRPEEFTDTYKDDLLKLIRERSKRGAQKASPPPRGAREPRVLDLVAALKGSLKSAGRSSHKRSVAARVSSASSGTSHRSARKATHKTASKAAHRHTTRRAAGRRSA